MQNFAKMCKILQKCSKTQQICAKMRKIVQNIVWKSKKLAEPEKSSTDGVSSVSIFFHLWLAYPSVTNCVTDIQIPVQKGTTQCLKKISQNLMNLYINFETKYKFILFDTFDRQGPLESLLHLQIKLLKDPY